MPRLTANDLLFNLANIEDEHEFSFAAYDDEGMSLDPLVSIKNAVLKDDVLILTLENGQRFVLHAKEI